MNTWILKVASYKNTDDILELIASGTKKIETRPFTPKDTKNYGNIKEGDELVFISTETNREVKKIAKGGKVYKSIHEMLQHENCEEIFPGIESTTALEAVYEKVKVLWGEEYKYNIETYGIVAIYIGHHS